MRRELGARAFIVVLAAATAASCAHELADPPPQLTSLTPSVVCTAQAPSTVTLAGANLTPLPTHTLAGAEALALPIVTLHGAAEVTPPVRWESEAQMSVDLPPELPPGVYDVVVGNPDGKTATLAGALGAVAPPSVRGSPQICDSGADQTITLMGQGFLVAGGAQPSVTLYDGTGAVVLSAPATTSGCSPAAAPSGTPLAACTTLAFTVAKNALTPGTYSLRVTNPPPAVCAPTDAITLTVLRNKC